MCEISGQVCTSPEPVVVIVLAGQDRLLLLLLLVTWSGAQLSLDIMSPVGQQSAVSPEICQIWNYSKYLGLSLFSFIILRV